MNGRTLFQKHRKKLQAAVRLVSVFPRKFRTWRFEANRNTNGMIGIVLRYIYAASLAKAMGDNVAIMPGCFFKHLENIEVGNNVSFQPMCFIGGGGSILIGSDVSLAHGVTVLSTSHSFEQMDVPIKYQKIRQMKTVISDDVWVGCGTVVLGGVQVGRGAIIGANATVTHDVAEYTIVAGSPARRIRDRRGKSGKSDYLQ